MGILKKKMETTIMRLQRILIGLQKHWVHLWLGKLHLVYGSCSLFGVLYGQAHLRRNQAV